MNTEINKILATINKESLHRSTDNEPFKIMDVMTIDEVEASLSIVTRDNVVDLVASINNTLAN